MLGMDCENPVVVDAAVALDVPPKIGGIDLTLPAGADEMKMKCHWQTIRVLKDPDPD